MRRALVFHLDPAAPVPASAVVDLSSPLITAPLNTSQLLITTNHNSSQLITSQLITVPLLTPHLSHHNFSSQLITTYHIPTHHSSTSHTTSHTSLITSELITAPLLTPHITSPLLTPHFSHLPEVHINLRYIKAWHMGLSGPFIAAVSVTKHWVWASMFRAHWAKNKTCNPKLQLSKVIFYQGNKFFDNNFNRIHDWAQA